MDTAYGDPLRRKEDTSDDRTELKGPPVPARDASGERVVHDRAVPTDAAQSQVVLGDDASDIEEAHEQGATFADLDLGGTESHQRASFSDPIAPPELTPDGELGTGEA